MPGTEAKLQILEGRAQAGVSLWHPDDAPNLKSDLQAG
jgi:hypothetical protein